jgi:hypothetical protein
MKYVVESYIYYFIFAFAFKLVKTIANFGDIAYNFESKLYHTTYDIIIFMRARILIFLFTHVRFSCNILPSKILR